MAVTSPAHANVGFYAAFFVQVFTVRFKVGAIRHRHHPHLRRQDNCPLWSATSCPVLSWLECLVLYSTVLTGSSFLRIQVLRLLSGMVPPLPGELYDRDVLIQLALWHMNARDQRHRWPSKEAYLALAPATPPEWRDGSEAEHGEVPLGDGFYGILLEDNKISLKKMKGIFTGDQLSADLMTDMAFLQAQRATPVFGGGAELRQWAKKRGLWYDDADERARAFAALGAEPPPRKQRTPAKKWRRDCSPSPPDMRMRWRQPAAPAPPWLPPPAGLACAPAGAPAGAPASAGPAFAPAAPALIPRPASADPLQPPPAFPVIQARAPLRPVPPLRPPPAHLLPAHHSIPPTAGPVRAVGSSSTTPVRIVWT